MSGLDGYIVAQGRRVEEESRIRLESGISQGRADAHVESNCTAVIAVAHDQNLVREQKGIPRSDEPSV